MKLKPEDLPRIIEMIPGAQNITAEPGGIRIYNNGFEHEMPVIGEIMAAALTLKLDPSQVVCNIRYELGHRYSTLTEDPDSSIVDVTFLYESI